MVMPPSTPAMAALPSDQPLYQMMAPTASALMTCTTGRKSADSQAAR
jgi:hypothetical protein